MILYLIPKVVPDLCQFIGEVVGEVDPVCFGEDNIKKIATAVVKILCLSPCREVGGGLYPVSLIIGSLGDYIVGVFDLSHNTIGIVFRKLGPLPQSIHNGLELTPVVSLSKSVVIVFYGGDVRNVGPWTIDLNKLAKGIVLVLGCVGFLCRNPIAKDIACLLPGEDVTPVVIGSGNNLVLLGINDT